MDNPACPVCGVELVNTDYFGKLMHSPNYYDTHSWIEKKGEIYQCNNEECEVFQNNYWTHEKSDELHEGYPC